MTISFRQLRFEIQFSAVAIKTALIVWLWVGVQSLKIFLWPLQNSHEAKPKAEICILSYISIKDFWNIMVFSKIDLEIIILRITSSSQESYICG